MRIFKKLALSVIIVISLFLVTGYIYFDRKFTPPENKLKVSGRAENIPMTWDAADENSHAALLLPVRLKGVDLTFYMQFDSGSPTTLFYKNSLKSIGTQFRTQIQSGNGQNHIPMQFSIGEMGVISDFELLNYGSAIDSDANNKNIIGTIGTDLLEKRIVILDFKKSGCSFVENFNEKGFETFEFRKRKIMIPGVVGGENLKLLYDSGSSGYELLTNREEWERYRIPNGSIKIEKGNSWGNVLTVVSAPADQPVKIGKSELQLSEVTHVEGTSQMQNLLMKTSGMQGMIGNKIFLNHRLILDCKNKKFKVE